jgi:hypothetical protein
LEQALYQEDEKDEKEGGHRLREFAFDVENLLDHGSTGDLQQRYDKENISDEPSPSPRPVQTRKYKIEEAIVANLQSYC